ncbi:MAG: glycosyltransferase family protein [Desulfovibrio sp.]|nr:glycosyltransferase family protein [Desulfovibrio sp.]
MIQARMGSTRLPGKVLREIAGRPMLDWCLARVERVRGLEAVVTATTILPVDNAIVDHCQARGRFVLRGAVDDLLDRYMDAARSFEADAVVRVTSDCPLIDPEVIEEVLSLFLRNQPDVHYASNVHPLRTFPRGMDVEVIRRDALERAWREDSRITWREHVTPYIQRNSDMFNVRCLKRVSECPQYRLTVDTIEDFELIELILTHFGNDRFKLDDIVDLLSAHPEWTLINSNVVQKLVEE